jgi:predicted PolB exonuclease-like 3'-5' exonuclease
MRITFDIETVPCQWPGILEEFAAAVQAPAIYKKPESIAAWLEENRAAEAEAAWLKTSFDGGMGQIVCIGYAFDDGAVNALSVPSLSAADESSLLQCFFADLQKAYSGTSGTRPVLIGHNSNAFDVPFIWKRAIVHGIKPPHWFPRDPKPWGESTFDTMTQWSGVKDRISMDKLCRVLGIPGKGDGPTGADVWPMVRDGKIDEVAEYCRADVERTRAIYKRMVFA